MSMSQRREANHDNPVESRVPVGDRKQTMAIEHKTSDDMKEAEHTKLDMYTNEPCGMGMS